MKKFVALFLIVLMVLSLAACGKFNEKDLVGKWDCELSFKELGAFNNQDAEFGEDFPQGILDSVSNIKLKIRLEYYKNGTCHTLISKENWDKFLVDQLDAIMEYMKNEGLLEIYKQQNINVSTLEELDNILKTVDTSIDEQLAEIRSQAEKSLKENEDDYVGDLNDEGYYYLTKKPEKYSVVENSIIFINSEDKEEITYFKEINKNTIEVTRIVADFEEYNTSIIFKRAK